MKKITSKIIQDHVDDVISRKVKRGVYYSHNGCELSLGNLKIGEDTLILNMGPAYGCPSDTLGKCACSAVCYAKKAEKQYPGARAYRRRQKFYWLQTSADDILNDIKHILENKRFRETYSNRLRPLKQKIQYLRLNESGDFWSQKCVNKLDHIARGLRREYNIITYTYTARDDLHFENCHFAVKGSGHFHGNNGACIVRTQAVIDENKSGQGNAYIEKFHGHTRYFAICPGDCSKCILCKEFNNLNIVFPLHTSGKKAKKA